ncbi:MAG: putative diguanylate-cyclase [Actinomycetia bacterium]|nr:putative diguanylate-cyclase [Actinomycetes bacterium]
MTPSERTTHAREVFRALLRNTEALFLVVDAEGIVTLFDGAPATLVVVDPAAVVGRSIDDVLATQPDGVSHMHRALAGEQCRAVIELAGRTFEAWFAPLVGADGRIEGAVAGATDITQRLIDAEALRTGAVRMQALVRNATDVISILNADGTVRWSSPSGTRLFGYEEGSFGGVNIFALIHPEDAPSVAEAFSDALSRPGPTATVQYRLAHAQGGWRWAETTATNLLHDPAIQGVVTSTRDVTDRRRARDLLGVQSTILESIAQGEPLPATLAELARLAQANDPDVGCAVVLLDHRLMRVGASLGMSDDWLAAVEGAEADWSTLGGAFPIRSARTGRTLGAVVRVEPGAQDIDSGALAITDLAVHLAAIAIERDESMHRLTHAAVHDPLTGLTNRAGLIERLEAAAPGDLRVAVLFCDLDRFKLINDSLGHHVGDQVLGEVAARISTCLRERDLVARFGGDEFVLVLDGADRATAESVAQRVLESLSAPLRVGDLQLGISASIGICMSDSSLDANDLLRHADSAMYRAKKRGLGTYFVYESTEMGEHVRDRLETESDLRVALARGELVMHLQPTFTVGANPVPRFVEALVRWQHPTRGLLHPVEFLDVAEESGLIVTLGRAVLHQSCAAVAAVRAESRTAAAVVPGLSVNVSAAQLHGTDLVDEVRAALASSGLRADQLVIEVTESTLAVEDAETVVVLERLRAMGVQVAIDDFGTGYSSLARLRDLPVDIIKIDQAFIARLGTGAEHRHIVQAIVSLAHALNLQVVAEGVETVAQLAELQVVGCDMVQGHLLAPAVPPSELLAWLLGTPRATTVP